MVKELYVVRHGRTEWNEARRMQGRLDSPLTQGGRGHARRHGELLKRERVDRLIVSPLGRTRATAAIANQTLDVPVSFDERLMERHCGDWEGLPVDEAERRFPDAWAEHRRDAYHFRPPGGENLPDMLERVVPLLDSLADLPEEKVALVSHGVMGRVVVTHFLGLLPGESVEVAQPNDVVYCLDFTDGAVCCRFYRDGDGPTAGVYRVPKGA